MVLGSQSQHPHSRVCLSKCPIVSKRSVIVFDSVQMGLIGAIALEPVWVHGCAVSVSASWTDAQTCSCHAFGDTWLRNQSSCCSCCCNNQHEEVIPVASSICLTAAIPFDSKERRPWAIIRVRVAISKSGTDLTTHMLRKISKHAPQGSDYRKAFLLNQSVVTLGDMGLALMQRTPDDQDTQ